MSAVFLSWPVRAAQDRIDTPHVVLTNATQRRQTGIVQNVDIVERSSSPFLKFDLLPSDKVRFVTGVRGDIFSYKVTPIWWRT
jgi:hypothetical protein